MTLKFIRKLIRHSPLIIGTAGFLLFSAFGLVSLIQSGLRLAPVVGIVVGAALILSSLIHRFDSPKRRIYYLILLGLYIIGVLFIGLRPRSTGIWHIPRPSQLLTLEYPSTWDTLINIIGFIPLGFLFVITFRYIKRLAGIWKQVLPAVFLSTAISLLIETGQHLLAAGRSSSLTDVITNTIGAVIGAAYAAFYLKAWE
ncbi:MAG: VanZ family protein [Spirochaetia bacterium]